jgi:hypothetical protein
MLGSLLRSMFRLSETTPQAKAAVNAAGSLSAHELRLLSESLFSRAPDYQAMLKRLHEHLKPATYLEIGIHTGSTLDLAAPATRAIGVDPAPQLRHAPFSNQRVFAQTSDDFFAGTDVAAELGGQVEFAFIDGLHHFDFALRDFANVERLARRDTVVAIHDCWPLDAVTSARERSTVLWTGDVWRLIVLLRKYRPDLSVHTIGAPPSGLGLVLGLDPSSTLLMDRHDELVREFMALQYRDIEATKAQSLGLLPADWPAIKGLLDARPKP